MQCGLVVQQPMRTPATASVNVIMKEDTAASFDVAKYKGIEDRCLVHHNMYVDLRVLFCIVGSQSQIESLKQAFEIGCASFSKAC